MYPAPEGVLILEITHERLTLGVRRHPAPEAPIYGAFRAVVTNSIGKRPVRPPVP